MTIINPNSIAGITSVTAQADIINFYKSNGTPGSLQIDGCNFNTTNGISTFNNLVVGGTLTYEDVKNVDSVGIITARGGLNVTANTDTDTLNVSGISTFGGTVKIPTVPGTNTNGWFDVLYQTASGTIDGGSGLRYDPGGSALDANGLKLYASQVRGDGNDLYLTVQNYNGPCGIRLSNILRFETGSAERLRIDTGGRLLINRTNNDSPGGYNSKLQIRDTTYTASISIVRNDPGGGGPVLVFGKSRNATQSDGTVVQSGDTLGALDFYGADGTDLNSAGAQILVQVDGTPGSNDMPGRIVFKTTADGANSATERLRITSAGLVGINQTPSTAQLVVKNSDDSNRNSIDIYNDNGNQSTSISQDSSGAGSFLQKNNSGTIKTFIKSYGDSYLTGGGLLIGTSTSNGFKFKISDGGGYEFALNPNDSGINSFVNYNRSGGAYVDCKIVQKELQLWSGTSPAERLRIDSSGRVLYGTTSSTRETSLVLVGNSNSYTTNPGTLDLFVGNTPSNLGGMGQICFGTQNVVGARIDGRADQDWTVGSARGSHLRFLTVTNGSTTLTERLRITNAGFVGIGEDVPDLKLHVNGTNALPATTGSTAAGHLCLRDKAGNASHGMYMGVSHQSPWSSWIQAQDGNALGTEYPLLLNPNGGGVIIGNTAATFGSSTLAIEKASTGIGARINLYNGQASATGATCEIHVGQNYRDANRIIFGRENNNNWQSSAAGAASFMAFYTNTAGNCREVLRLTSGGALEAKAESKGRVNFNDCQYYQWGGSAACSAAWSVSVPVLSSGNIYKIVAYFSHHANSYAAYREGIYGAYSGHGGVQMNNDLTNHTSTNGGSWTISRGGAGSDLVVTHNAGSYNGSGYWFVWVLAGNQ